MHGVHASMPPDRKSIAPGQLVAPSKGGSYTHQNTHAAPQTYSAPATGHWDHRSVAAHRTPSVGNLFTQTGPAAMYGQGKAPPPYGMHALPPGAAPGAPGDLHTNVRASLPFHIP